MKPARLSSIRIIVVSREMLYLSEKAVLLSPEERLIVLKYVRKLNHSKNRSQAKSKRV